MSTVVPLRTDARAQEIHPDADIFPMLDNDAMASLAADIKANGLLHPIILNSLGVVIDGRNRLRACEIAGVAPRYEYLPGFDDLPEEQRARALDAQAKAAIVSANLERRNLSAGQKAIALAMIYPDPGKRGRGNKSEAIKSAETTDFSRSRLNQARAILRHSRALADAVLAGQTKFDAALTLVHDQQLLAESDGAKLGELRADAPDLAELVDDDRLSLKDGYAALVERRNREAKAEANKRENILRISETAWQATTAWAAEDFIAGLEERFKDGEFRELWLKRVRPQQERIREVQKGAQALVAFLARIGAERTNV